MATYVSSLLDNVGTLFSPIFTMATGDTYIGGLVVFSIGLTIVGSVLHFLLART